MVELNPSDSCRALIYFPFLFFFFEEFINPSRGNKHKTLFSPILYLLFTTLHIIINNNNIVVNTDNNNNNNSNNNAIVIVVDDEDNY